MTNETYKMLEHEYANYVPEESVKMDAELLKLDHSRQELEDKAREYLSGWVTKIPKNSQKK